MSLQSIISKLPQVRGGIDQTLADHQSQARSVASYGFTRLPQFYSADTLASTLVVEVPRVPVPPLAELGLPVFDVRLGERIQAQGFAASRRIISPIHAGA